MPGFGLLVDDFNDNVRDPVVWSQSYGDPVEAGGRARIPCTTGYAAYRSASSYTLAWSQVSARVYPPSAAGASTAVVSFLVLSDVGGTDAGFLIDAAQNAMGLYLRVGYADGGALFPSYDPVAHAFLRLREDGGTLRWETSPDGTVWTVRRTAASPAWVSQSNLSLLIEAHRDAGVGDFAEADQLNVGRPGRVTAASRTGAGLVGLARSTSTVRGG
ncbi:hypothetical protein [Streptomyces neyagawaensis]|uniref:hypothetical protein n=1 Tax=Streptomyces neyagawaensis TaxID=42238 RepID=UPI0006E41EF1|nr:hypothetical protein [Streptomyces neyagawaensis]MCL6733293.1 hypothetical protein [Streptomyces neyagawaensis]MDE1685095.1 hypothetical protein [Streptomyces neyagawaensis]